MTTKPAKRSSVSDYVRMLGDIKTRIRAAQIRATFAANRELILLYWDIGRMIVARQKQEGWGAAVIPRSFLDPVRPMTSTIAAEMGEAVVGSTHYHALFAIGLVLFITTFVFNIVAEVISRRFRLKLGINQ